MSKINIQDIEKLARLARIGLTDSEKSSLLREMTTILDFVKELDEVEVAGILPTSQVTGLVNVVREDRVEKCILSRDELLSNAPETEKGFIKVKSVL